MCRSGSGSGIPCFSRLRNFMDQYGVYILPLWYESKGVQNTVYQVLYIERSPLSKSSDKITQMFESDITVSSQ